ncbi:HET-domain-containing protein [Hypoxylon fuscum]|nr:HET-domain-containing protein [Hypoxylon fuscum]
MLCNETNQQFIGNVSEYNNPDCPFCGLVSEAVGRAWGAKLDSANRRFSTSNSCQLFIQSRSPLSVKENGHIHHPQPRLLLATDNPPPTFHHNRVPLRQIDRVKKRFIIAEIESLPNESELNYLPRLDVGTYINTLLLREWLRECQKHEHSTRSMMRGCCDLFQRQYPFRLIDVDEECLVQKDRRCDYMALSYVWGPLPTLLSPGDNDQVPILLTLKRNVRELSISQSLSRSRPASRLTGRVSRTVRDAMEFTRQMGMKYLWVDTLCIIQDEPDDKSRLIGKMDEIYNCATATIIAAAGSDADAGLRGVSPRMGHPIEPTKIVDASSGTTIDLSLCLPSLCEEVRSETWNTRGWVFQEQSLSQRCFYFTSEEVFFNCSEMQRREGYDYVTKRSKDVDVEVRTGPPWWTRNLRKDLDPTPYHYLGDAGGGLGIQAYQTAVQEYSRKNLTFSRDIFDAFEGIFNRFKESGDASELSIHQTQGIPSHLLYQALLWFPMESSKKRLCDDVESGKVTDLFSTWSWASWIGPVEFVFADNMWLSRNISQAPVKRVPIYVPITYWSYGGSKQKFWTRDIWKHACETMNMATGYASDDFNRTKSYLTDCIGIDVNMLLDQSRSKLPSLRYGELGFFGPYLTARQFRISAPRSGQVGSLEVSTHQGEFRFDGEVQAVDELVAAVTSNTITKPPNTQTIFVGLTTRDGVSRRVGLGYIYYSKDSGAAKPQWQYKLLTIR